MAWTAEKIDETIEKLNNVDEAVDVALKINEIAKTANEKAVKDLQSLENIKAIVELVDLDPEQAKIINDYIKHKSNPPHNVIHRSE